MKICTLFCMHFYKKFAIFFNWRYYRPQRSSTKPNLGFKRRRIEVFKYIQISRSFMIWQNSLKPSFSVCYQYFLTTFRRYRKLFHNIEKPSKFYTNPVYTKLTSDFVLPSWSLTYLIIYSWPFIRGIGPRWVSSRYDNLLPAIHGVNFEM